MKIPPHPATARLASLAKPSRPSPSGGEGIKRNRPNPGKKRLLHLCNTGDFMTQTPEFRVDRFGQKPNYTPGLYIPHEEISP